MKTYLNLITKINLLNTLKEDFICDNLNNQNFITKKYNTNNLIHIAGEKCDRLEIILSGSISLERIDESGDLLSVNTFYAGDLIGGNLLFSSKPFFIMSVTSKSETIILEIKKEFLFDIAATNKNFLKRYLTDMSDNTMIMGNKVIQLVSTSIRSKIISYLKIEYNHQNNLKINLNFSKKILAEKLGIQRTSLSRELKKMKNDLLIDFDRNSITIIKKSILKEELY